MQNWSDSIRKPVISILHLLLAHCTVPGPLPVSAVYLGPGRYQQQHHICLYILEKPLLVNPKLLLTAKTIVDGQIVGDLIVHHWLVMEDDRRCHLHLSWTHCRSCCCFFHGSHMSSLRCDNIFGVVDVGAGNLASLKVVVDRGHLCVCPHLGGLEFGKEGFLGSGHLGGVGDVAIWNLPRLELL